MRADQLSLFGDHAEKKGAKRGGEASPPSSPTESDFAGDRSRPQVVESALLEAKRRIRAHATGTRIRGLTAKWSREFGWVSLHDPSSGEWHDIVINDAPRWAKWEARKRKQLYKAGDRRAYDLTGRDLQQLWEGEQVEMWKQPAVTEHGIFYEDYIEEDA